MPIRSDYLRYFSKDEIEAQIDDTSCQLWGLSKEEIIEIQESLEELQ